MSEEERERKESDKQLRKEERGDTRQEERDSCHRWKKRIRGCKESPLPMRRGWNRGGRREGASKREETPPKALLYLSYNYHNRASNHPSPPPYSPPRPPSTDHLPPPFLQPLPNSRNRKLETREYIFSSFFSAWNCLPRDVDRWQSMLTAKDHWNRGINVPGQARNFVHFTDSWQRGEIISLFRIRSIIFDSNFFSFLNFLKQLYLYLWRMTFPWIISIT